MQKTFAVSRSLHCVCVYEFLMIYKLTDKNFMFHNLIIFYHNSSNQKKTLSKNKTIQSSSIKPKWMSAIVKVPNGKHYFYISF